jgi:hypothetical protein
LSSTILDLDTGPDSPKRPDTDSINKDPYNNKNNRPTPEILCLVSERVGGDPVRKGDDPVGEVMHGQPGDDLPQLHAGSSCAPAHHTHASRIRAH